MDHDDHDAILEDCKNYGYVASFNLKMFKDNKRNYLLTGN